MLTERGQQQAADVGQFLAKEEFSSILGSCVVVSPMKRAQQTLDKIVLSRPFNTVITVPEVREVELWEWQGRLKDDLATEDPLFQLWRDDPSSVQLSNRCVVADLWERATVAWGKIRSDERLAGQRHVLIVAHGAMNQALLWSAMGQGTEKFRQIQYPNCGLIELHWPSSSSYAEKYRWLYPDRHDWVHPKRE